jgi:hypothetical protein
MTHKESAQSVLHFKNKKRNIKNMRGEKEHGRGQSILRQERTTTKKGRRGKSKRGRRVGGGSSDGGTGSSWDSAVVRWATPRQNETLLS